MNENINQTLLEDLNQNKMNFAQCLFPNKGKKFSVFAKFCEDLVYHSITGQRKRWVAQITF